MDCGHESGRESFSMSLKEVEMNVQWRGTKLERFAGGVQQHWTEFGARLGLCLQEGKARLMNDGFKFGKSAGYGDKKKILDVKAASSLFTGFLKNFGDDIGHKVDEGKANFVKLVASLNQHQRHFGKPLFASLSSSSRDILPKWEPEPLFQLAMTTDQVSKRLDGVPVYTVSNSANEFVLVSDMSSQKSLGIFCFRQEDAEALLSQVRDREPSLGRGAKVVAVSLDKVYQLNTEGIAFRFLPDPHQVKNALELQAKAKTSESRRAFDGVPIFQSDNLILRSNNRRFCPIFFCREDLEKALSRAFKQQQRVNPALQVNSNIQAPNQDLLLPICHHGLLQKVGSFEDVLKRMESNEEDSGWGDIVFIPPGMDAFSHLGKAVAQGSSRVETVVA